MYVNHLCDVGSSQIVTPVRLSLILILIIRHTFVHAEAGRPSFANQLKCALAKFLSVE